MVRDKLETIATHLTSAEANLFRGRLDAEGIAAYLGGEATADWFWHFGSALSGVKVEVAGEDLARATEILASIQEALEDRPANHPSRAAESADVWTCVQCDEQVDAEFDVCWTCGTSSAGVEDKSFEPATAPIRVSEGARPPSPLFAMMLVLCPPLLLLYALTKAAVWAFPSITASRSAPGVDSSEDEDSVPRETHGADDKQAEPSPEILRAWRASVIGICFFPPLMNIYSTWLVLRYLFSKTEKRRAGWRLPATLLMNLLVFLSVGGIAYYAIWPHRLLGPGHYRSTHGKAVPMERTIEIPGIPG